MCSNCYHRKGRDKKPDKCEHIEKPHYALGMCQNCYQTKYSRNRRKNERKGIDQSQEISGFNDGEVDELIIDFKNNK
jgi:hypothetical protein